MRNKIMRSETRNKTPRAWMVNLSHYVAKLSIKYLYLETKVQNAGQLYQTFESKLAAIRVGFCTVGLQ